MCHFEHIYLENYARDVLIVCLRPFGSFFFNSWAFDTVDGIHPFVIIELFVHSFQRGRSVGTGNVLIATFTYTSMIFGESSQPSELNNERMMKNSESVPWAGPSRLERQWVILHDRESSVVIKRERANFNCHELTSTIVLAPWPKKRQFYLAANDTVTIVNSPFVLPCRQKLSYLSNSLLLTRPIKINWPLQLPLTIHSLIIPFFASL